MKDREREKIRDRFIEAWTSMASLFSFSPSTARVCGLLVTSGEPITSSQISERLGLSRGNVSMCLKDLRSWGVVRRTTRPGDRREFYESRGDLFEQTLSIARERKRREFDPMVGGALEALGSLADGAPDPEKARIQSIVEYLGAVDRLGREILDRPEAATLLIGLVKNGFVTS